MVAQVALVVVGGGSWAAPALPRSSKARRRQGEDLAGPPSLQLPEDRAAELLGGCRQYPLDALVVRRYKGLVEQYGFAGGIYVQVCVCVRESE